MYLLLTCDWYNSLFSELYNDQQTPKVPKVQNKWECDKKGAYKSGCNLVPALHLR